MNHILYSMEKTIEKPSCPTNRFIDQPKVTQETESKGRRGPEVQAYSKLLLKERLSPTQVSNVKSHFLLNDQAKKFSSKVFQTKDQWDEN